MAQRITRRDLEAVCTRINRIAIQESEPAYNTAGAYHIDGAYGGWALYRWTGDHGAVSDVFRSGHMPARELYNRMQAYIDGLCERTTV
jgi:hypothetical protein